MRVGGLHNYSQVLVNNDASWCVIVRCTHAYAYDRAARARVGRWTMLSNDPRAYCSRIFARRDLALPKIRFKIGNKTDFFRFAKSLFVFSSQIFKGILKVYREIEYLDSNHFDIRHFIMK